MNSLCIKTGILLQWVNSWLTKHMKLLVRCERILRSCKSERLWSVPRSQSTLYLSRVPEQCLAAIVDCAWYTDYYGYFTKRFWTTTCSRMTTLSSFRKFTEFGLIFSRIETWHHRKYNGTRKGNKTRTGEFVNTCTTLSKWKWYAESYWWNLFSRWYDGLSEISRKVNFNTEVCSRTADPHHTMHWIKEVEIAKSIDEFMTLLEPRRKRQNLPNYLERKAVFAIGVENYSSEKIIWSWSRYGD